MSGTLAGAVPKLLIYCTVLRECVGNRFAERNRKYRWPQSSHRYGPICKTAYRIRSVAVRLCDLRTELPRHRGHTLWMCTRLINKTSTAWVNDATPFVRCGEYSKLLTNIPTYVFLLSLTYYYVRIATDVL